MKIAQFRKHLNESTSYDLILDARNVEGKYSIYRVEDGYIRLSEWVEVEFPPRDPQEHVPEQLASLDAAERELRLKFEQKLHEIADARARVRALTYQPDSQDSTRGFSVETGVVRPSPPVHEVAESESGLASLSGSGPSDDLAPYTDIDEGKYPPYESPESQHGVAGLFRP